MVPSGVGGQRPMFGMVPVTTTSIHHQQNHLMIPQVSVKHEPMDSSHSVINTRVTANLYLCDSGKASSRERPAVETNASVDLLDKEHKLLIQTRIKNSLSSFVPDIPGEFDSSNNPESMLRTLIDRPPIGGREFLPLSDQSLLGFRLHPGPLPDQYRLDPLTLTESHKHHKKKKKHRHKHVDKTEESSITNYSPSVSREHTPPRDPCDFIKPENTPNFFPPVHTPRPTIHHPSQSSQQPPPQPHHIQNNPINFNSSIIQSGNSSTFLNMNMGSPTMATPQSVIVQAKPYSHMQAYTIPGQPTGAAGVLASGLKIPAKPKKKRHNNEGPEGVPKKKKKKDKDKDKNKEKKRRKHHNPEGIPTSSLSAIPSSSNLATTLPSVSSAFTIHPTNQ